MINKIFGFVVGPKNNGIVPRSDNVSWNGAQDARTLFVASIGIGTHDVISYAIVNSISVEGSD